MLPDTGDLSSFCNRRAVDVAADLIGWELLVDGVGGPIVETEAYTVDDLASHSFGGPRKANRSMWLPPGSSYVYRIYGLHFCLNVVCADAGAVLIRAIEPRHSIEVMQGRRGQIPLESLASGPGKLCQALAVDLSLDGLPMDKPPFRLSRGVSSALVATLPECRRPITTSPRIGISRNASVEWRFCATGSRFLSRPAGGSRAPQAETPAGASRAPQAETIDGGSCK